MQKLRTLSCLLVCLVILSCAQSKFKGVAHQDTTPAPDAGAEAPLPAEGEKSEDSVKANAELREGTETFTVELTKNMVDIVWVIDNSGSMVEEVAQIRKNFEDFISNTSNVAEVKLALITSSTVAVPGVPRISFQTEVDMPATALAKGHVQINQFVDSTNLLAVAAAASCPAASSMVNVTVTATSEEHRICGLTLKADPTDPLQVPLRLENPTIIDRVKGSLTNFYRAEAKRVYVFVTDDDSQGLKSDKFFTAVQVGTPNIKPYVFAFRGTASQSTCKIARAGADYDLLAKTSGGAVFDICAADWKPYFNQLTASINDIARTEFTLQKAKVQKIVSILIDEKILDPQLYLLEDGKVKINPSALIAGQKITINYSYAEQL